MWDPGQKPQNGKTKFFNLLILEHLENYFIEPLNKLLIRCEINGLKNLFVAFAPHPPFIHTTLIAVKPFLLLKHHEFT